MFLFSSIHVQCLYRPDAQSIYLSTYLSIYLYCVKSMFIQNTFSFDFTLRFSPRINIFISLLACFWMMQPRNTLRKSSAKKEARKRFLVSKKREPDAMMSCLMMTQLARVVFFVSGGAAAGVLQVRGAPGIMIRSRWKFTKQFHQTQLAVQLIVQASGCAVCCEAVNFFFMGKIDFIKKTLLNWAGNFFFMGKINFIKKTLLKWSYLRRFLHK